MRLSVRKFYLQVTVVVLALSGVFISDCALSDDAVVLPKGFSRLLLDGQYNLPFNKRFNKDGNVEDIATDFNANLNRNVFPNLSLVESAFGLPSGSGTFGRSVVTQEITATKIVFQPAYGLTDKLSIGMNIPYWWIQNDVTARLDNSTATLGFNPLVPGGVAPIGFAGTLRPTTESIQNLLASRGFKRVGSFKYEGLGDIEGGFRYQYYRSESFRHAVTAGARLPTGRKNDPDDLMDIGPGDGVYAFLLHSNHDFMFQPDGVDKRLGFPSAGSILFNTTFRYAHPFADKEALRVCNIHNPICENRDGSVRRQLGDVVEAEVSPKVGIAKGFIAYGVYKYVHKFKDHYSGDKGFDYGALSDESSYNDHSYSVGLTFTTLPWYVEKKFPVPLVASISYWERFAADNNLWKRQYIGFSLATYF